MICYCKKNTDGIIVAIGHVDDPGQIPAGHESITKTERDAWLAQRKAEAEAKRNAFAAIPSPAEQLRADVDYIAAMTGVSL